MAKPIIAARFPVKVSLKKGQEYLFCTCGRSANQPFCDGSHIGTSFTPKVIVAHETTQAFWCSCKQTANPPLCDGTHKQFSDKEVGRAAASNNRNPSLQNTQEEPTLTYIHQLAKEGLGNAQHGPMVAMGVPKYKLPDWDNLQIMVAQFAKKPLMENVAVDSSLTIGPESKKPLQLQMPLMVSDMSFGALSEEAKIALARGAEMAGTGICSGEGGMLPEEQAENSRYFYQLASARFGYHESLLTKVQAFHFKGGQAAKTGTGGHLPASKNVGKIAEVRQIPAGQAAISPPTFADLNTPADFKFFADRVREITAGIPIGFKLSANHIEQDIEFAIRASADYLILDGRGGGTGAAPALFRDHISVPTIPALARARRYLDQQGYSKRVTLIVTGGLRVPSDFIKALALGADGIALSTSAMQAIGCIAARICHSNQCPSGIATQDPKLRQAINIEQAATRLFNFLSASCELMKVMARACGYQRLSDFDIADLSTFDPVMAQLAGVKFSGFSTEH